DRHPWMAGAIDEPGAIRRSDDAATAFEDDMRLILLRQRLRCGDAVRLHGRGVSVQQAGSLCWMWRQDGGRGAHLGLLSQGGVMRKQVRRVSVEYQRTIRVQRQWQQMLGMAVLS